MDHMTGSQLIVSFVIGLLIGATTAYFAERRGRSPLIWFFVGAFLGIFGLILLFILTSYAAKGAEKGKSEPVVFAAAPPLVALPVVAEKLWYYLDQKNQQYGPMPYAQIKDLLDRQELTIDTYVWCEGMENWKHISELTG
jgi:hypothetical protein